MKILIWGTGHTVDFFLNKMRLFKNDEIIAFVDNEKNMWNKLFHGKRVVSPMEIKKFSFDKIVICVKVNNHIKDQLIYDIKVPMEKIENVFDIERKYIHKLECKYQNTQDQEILDTISCFKSSGIQVFGNYFPKTKKYKIYRDKNEEPFVFYENKKIYFPKTFDFEKYDNNEYVSDIFYEQYSESPHLYISDKTTVSNGAVIIDAGACEGNFTIRFIDRIKKAYLIESDPIWIKCLKKTFKPYKDKVVICDKFLSRYDSDKTITLDSLVHNEKIDFLKMDIEGAEIDALLGAKEMLSNNDVKCSICSYHKMNDEENIKFIMNTLGYKTSVSKGYMFFVYDENIYDTLDLRRGIVYAYKN